MSEIRLENINKNFGDFVAVDNSSLTIKDGEFFVLLGSSGCGKTTTLRMIAGLEMPTSGKLLLDDEDVTCLRPSQRDIAFVFQLFALYPHMKVFQNLAFPLKCQGTSKAEIKQRVQEIAELLRIEHLLNRGVRGLSGGDRQRVALGRAIIRRPKAFLMDEPLSSLDAKLRDDLRIELKRIQMDLQATICYVTHDQMEAMTLADRIGVLSEGKLLQVGTPEEIYQNPVNTYVACRLGSPSINLLPRGVLGINGGPKGSVTMGIRPENIAIGKKGIATRILSVEHLGTETVVNFKMDHHKIAALAPPGKEKILSNR